MSRTCGGAIVSTAKRPTEKTDRPSDKERNVAFFRKLTIVRDRLCKIVFHRCGTLLVLSIFFPLSPKRLRDSRVIRGMDLRVFQRVFFGGAHEIVPRVLTSKLLMI